MIGLSLRVTVCALHLIPLNDKPEVVDQDSRLLMSFCTQPETRKSEQICNRSVKSCCQQADIWMRSLALYLSVLTGPQRPVNRSVRSCCDRAAAMLCSTGLLEAVVTELQQCCFQQACRKLTQSCSNAVFNNLRHTCCKPRKAPYEACVSTILNKKRPNRLPYFGCSVS